ncbi:hypothetical protein L6452_29134 [Arctium lappa]|uniref:Uncharacterized protein n=1 Tax=Arctium lappa TaxID=4217 RepID=A0ACB8ZGH9_ARCLA|nr:hypothetical protein L6452_29134 [Arctium lappa]
MSIINEQYKDRVLALPKDESWIINDLCYCVTTKCDVEGYDGDVCYAMGDDDEDGMEDDDDGMESDWKVCISQRT